MKLRKNKKEEIEILEFDENIKPTRLSQIKEFMSDKRNKAIVKLSIYGIFLLIVIIYIRVTTANNRARVINNSENINNTYENLPDTITNKIKLLNGNNNYTFKINVQINGIENINYFINGSYENNVMILNMDDKIYYYEDGSFYELINGLKDYTNNYFLNEFSYYFPKKIYNYLLKSSYQYRKEDLNGNLTINSKLSNSEFALINNNIIDNKDEIIIETTENSSNTINVYMDLTNYYNMYDENISKYIVAVEFNY